MKDDKTKKETEGACEQIEKSAEDSIGEQAEETSASKIGKFNGTDELLSAYNALQSEFTKRCQLIKQLQAELDGMRAQVEGESDSASSAENNAEPQAEACVEPQAEAAAADITEKAPPPVVIDAEYAAKLADIPEVMEACVARYKQRLIESRLCASPTGVAVIVPQKRPKTLSEAKLIADELLAKM